MKIVICEVCGKEVIQRGNKHRLYCEDGECRNVAKYLTALTKAVSGVKMTKEKYLSFKTEVFVLCNTLKKPDKD
jgi:hypothetical protein